MLVNTAFEVYNYDDHRSCNCRLRNFHADFMVCNPQKMYYQAIKKHATAGLKEKKNDSG